MAELRLAPARIKRCQDCEWCVRTTDGIFCGPPPSMLEVGARRAVPLYGTGEDLIDGGAGPVYNAPESYCPQGKWQGLEPYDLEAMAAEGEESRRRGMRETLKPMLAMALDHIKALSPDAAREALLDLVEVGLEDWLAKEITEELKLVVSARK